jgi:hypothetical protein
MLPSSKQEQRTPALKSVPVLKYHITKECPGVEI